MEKQIRVMIKEPDKDPEFRMIDNELKELQNIVGGYIETVTFDEMVVICNEEGRIMDMDFCCEVEGVSFVGPVIFAGYEEDEFVSLPFSKRDMEELLPDLWEL